MANNRQIDNITELLIVAISPALVMLMVGSLCYFAINCFYVGSFDGRLYFATALFVFAAVLVSRISIEEGREYASMFAVPLSITTILSLLKYTDASIWFLAPLVAFIWWSTDKLTWDCTVVDHKKDASGKGLLQTIGMDEPTADSNSDTESEESHNEFDMEATTNKQETESKSIWQQWIERRRRNHTPGVWVIYFGMAAIPIFGLGQMLLPENQFGPSFILLCVYVASALALLMATSFLQMRRYLNQRRLELSDGMAATWLSMGGVLVAGLMFLCLFLPRPNTGYSLVDHVSKIGSKDQRASRFAQGKQDAVDDEEVDGKGESDEQAERDSDKGTQKSDDAEQGSQSGDDPKTKGEKQSKRGEKSKGESDDSSSGDDESESENDRSSNDENKGDKSDRGDDSQEDSESKDGANESSDSQEDQNETSNSSSRFKFDPPELPDVLPSISMPPIPKLLYFIVIGALILFVFLRYGKQIGAAINAFIRDFLEMLRRLFGGKRRERVVEEESEEPEALEPARPFSSYPDPFAMGTVSQFSPQQLVNYTFEALQAWAYERDCGRTDEQTPLEFASQIAVSHKEVGSSAKSLAQLYNQVAYAPGSIHSDANEKLKRLWTILRRA